MVEGIFSGEREPQERSSRCLGSGVKVGVACVTDGVVSGGPRESSVRNVGLECSGDDGSRSCNEHNSGTHALWVTCNNCSQLGT